MVNSYKLELPNFPKNQSYANFKFITSPYIRSKKIFSFILFIKPEILEEFKSIKIGGDITKYKTVKYWFRKYMNVQLEKIKLLLNNPTWADFSTIWFLENDLLGLPYIDREGNVHDKPIFDMIISKLNNEIDQKKICLIWYQQTDSWKKYPYIGTVIRFLPFTMKNIDVCLLRDAHTTMPREDPSYGNYDRSWYITWQKKTSHKWWFYRTINYSPMHLQGEKSIGAATIAGRKINDEEYIVNRENWLKYFYLTPNNKQNDFYTDFSYGVDERLIWLILYRSKLMDNVYVVGVVFLFQLFYNAANPRDFIRFYNKDTRYLYDRKTDNFPDNPPTVDNALMSPRNLKFFNTKTKQFENSPLYCLEPKNLIQINTYWSGLKCFLLTLYNNYNNPNKNIDIFWKNVIEGKLSKSKNIFNTTSVKLIKDTPSRHHMAGYLFDSLYPFDEFNKNDDLIDYINNLRPSFNSPMNSCNILKQYTIGKKLEYDIYEKYNKTLKYKDNGQKIEREDISDLENDIIPVFYKRN